MITISCLAGIEVKLHSTMAHCTLQSVCLEPNHSYINHWLLQCKKNWGTAIKSKWHLLKTRAQFTVLTHAVTKSNNKNHENVAMQWLLIGALCSALIGGSGCGLYLHTLTGASRFMFHVSLTWTHLSLCGVQVQRLATVNLVLHECQ